MKTIYVLLIALVAVIGASGAAVLLASDQSGLPGYATRNSMIKEAYMFAVEHPDVLNGVNCYCGCMQHAHNGRLHSRGLLDCFRTTDGGFDRHGSECDMCVNDALQVKQMSLQGKTKAEIQSAIDSKYR